MKYVSGNLLEFKEDKFFKRLYESSQDVEEVKEEMTPEEKKKLAAELEKQGMSIVKKLNTNFSKFKYAASGNWQAFRDFWNEQSTPKEVVGKEGKFYKMYDSKYIVGVIKTPAGTAELNVWNSEAEDGNDEHEVFKTGAASVVKAFMDFFKNTFEKSMREVIRKEKARLQKIKDEEVKKQKEEEKAKQKEKVNAFMSESLNEEFSKLRDYFQKVWSTDDDLVLAVENDPYLKDKYGKYLNPEFDWYSMSEQELLTLWDEWAEDERERGSMNESKKGGQKKGPKPLTVPDKKAPAKPAKSSGKKK